MWKTKVEDAPRKNNLSISKWKSSQFALFSCCLEWLHLWLMAKHVISVDILLFRVPGESIKVNFQKASSFFPFVSAIPAWMGGKRRPFRNSLQ